MKSYLRLALLAIGSLYAMSSRADAQPGLRIQLGNVRSYGLYGNRPAVRYYGPVGQPPRTGVPQTYGGYQHGMSGYQGYGGYSNYGSYTRGGW